MIVQRIPATLSVMSLTLIISISLAVPLGVVAASRQGSWLDRAVSAFAVLGFSLPVFVLGYILAYIFALQLGWFPVQGYAPSSQGFRSLHWTSASARRDAVRGLYRIDHPDLAFGNA